MAAQHNAQTAPDMPMSTASDTSTIHPAERQRYERLAALWWDPRGPMRPLHVLNQLRSAYLLEHLAAHFGRAAADLRGLRVLDLGCGAGLASEALARAGAQVLGIDAAPRNIEVARAHAAAQGLRIEYRAGELVEQLRPEEDFDVVLVLEVVEHVQNLPGFFAQAAARLRPGGTLVASTINRTPMSWLLTIVGAEYVLRLLPRGTHRWQQFVKPAELDALAAASGLRLAESRGLRYVPLLHRAGWTGSRAVNYQSRYIRPAAGGA